MKHSFTFLCGIITCLSFSQTFTGKVIDSTTQQPVENVAVYFDNTTIGTITNSKGMFSINYSDAVQSTLVISFLGFNKVYISNYRDTNNVTINLKESKNELDEVYIAYDDGLTRRQKLRFFRTHFLGESKYGKSCKILNEDQLILRYNKQDKMLTASANEPLIILNRGLKYEIRYDLNDFEIQFSYANLKQQDFAIQYTYYEGTTFFKNLNTKNATSIFKKRQKVYQGSIQHFIRALFNNTLEEEGYGIFYRKFKVNPKTHITITDTDNEDRKKVVVTANKLSILFDKKEQSNLQVKIPEFYIDKYGNYFPIKGIYFGGEMGTQRNGDLLPMDFKSE